MVDVIPNSDVFAEEPCADTVVEKRTLIQKSRTAEIPEQEAYNIEYGRRFENNGVLPGRKLTRIVGANGFFRRHLCQAHRIELRRIWRVCLLPAGGGCGQHGHGSFRQCLLIPLGNTTRIEDAFGSLRRGKGSRSREFVLLRDIDHPLDCLRSLLRAETRSVNKIAIYVPA